jgi:MYXO-CTERM domain-containing protein
LPATALRPSYAGTFKQHQDTSNIHWDLLPNLPAPANAPNGADLLKMAERPRIDHMNSWTIQNSCAEDNWYNGAGAHNCYGREVSTFISAAAMVTMLDTPERDELVVSMIQLGIDNYGVLEAGGGWSPNGGHHSGRKWPIVFAARLLDDCDLLKVGEKYDDSHFGEDGQTYAGAGGKALFGWDCGGGQGTYFQDGCTGGGAKDCRDPAGQVDGCADYRNCCTSGYWVGQMLSTLMLHAETIWNHQPYFDYVDRWMSGDVAGGGSASSQFIEDMWAQYRSKLPPGAPASTVCGAGGTGTGGAGGTGAGGSAGSGGSGGNGGAAGASSGGSAGGGGSGGSGASDSGSDSGCGCRTVPAPTSPLAWLLLAAGAGLLSTRRRRFF